MINSNTPRLRALYCAALFCLLALALSRAAAAQQGSSTPAPTPTVAPTLAPTPAAADAQAGTSDANGNLQPAGSIAPPPAETANRAATAPATLRPPFPLSPERAQPLRVPRFESAPVIDGKLDDAVWKQAAVFSDFYQINPG